jgi:hypothetical protein
MMGNVYSIAVSALLNRLKGKPVKKSRYLNKPGITLGVVVFVPILFIKNATRTLIKKM